MFVWAPIPEAFRAQGSLEFSKQLLREAKVAVLAGHRLRRERRGLRALRAGGEPPPHPPGGARHPALPAGAGRRGGPGRRADAVGLGLLGFGTIGTGVAKLLQRNAGLIRERLGGALRLLRIADLETSRDRGVDLSGIHFDADPRASWTTPRSQIVIELVGGTEVARRLVLRALERGKPVVTANKALLALHGREIFEAARRAGVDVAFEASVGGGIPILRSLREGLAANRIERVYGIVNGTTNFVLTEMERTGEAFEVVLKRARELGYAEADPSFDVDGIDAAHKLTILAALCFGAELTFKEIPTEGIRGSSPWTSRPPPSSAIGSSCSPSRSSGRTSASRCACSPP